MLEPDPNQCRSSSESETSDSASSMNFDQWLETLQGSDRSFYNLMAMEVWSIAKTMDSLAPGFWNRFMSNRQAALKQFMEQKQAAHPEQSPPSSQTDL